MDITSLTISDLIKQQIVPKLKTDEEKNKIRKMGELFEQLGSEAVAWMPSEIIAALKHREIESEFKDKDWLDFISNNVISNYLSKQIIKVNKVAFRRKLTEVATSENTTAADIRVIDILKKIIDEADSELDNSVIHYTQFIPTRENYENAEYSKKEEELIRKELLETLNHLEIDTDYMSVIDKEKFLKEQQEIKDKIKDFAKRKKEITEKKRLGATPDIKTNTSKFEQLKKEVLGGK